VVCALYWTQETKLKSIFYCCKSEWCWKNFPSVWHAIQRVQRILYVGSSCIFNREDGKVLWGSNKCIRSKEKGRNVCCGNAILCKEKAVVVWQNMQLNGHWMSNDGQSQVKADKQLALYSLKDWPQEDAGCSEGST